jgi:hypothetical protein
MSEEKVNHLKVLEKLSSLEDKINYVAKQIGLDYDPSGIISLDRILSTYLDLRNQIFDFRQRENEHWNEAYIGAREYFLKTQGDYFVSYEELSKMTLQEICEKIN